MNFIAKQSQTLLDPGDVVGPFKILSNMPKNGGMSELYVAQFMERPGVRVALKINRQIDKTSETPRNVYQDLLRKEVRLLRELRHPGVVRIYPFSVYAGDNKVAFQAKLKNAEAELWYYVMEYLPAGNLESQLPAISKMSEKWVVEFFYQLLITVQYMHRMGYAHCDLKPDNIMLREPPDQNRIPQPVLIDFGSTERVDRPIQTPCVTPSYSPPEVLLASQRSDIDPADLDLRPDKIDVWSLGAIFYALLAGKAMFSKKDRKEVTSAVINGEIAKIEQVRPEVHASMDMMLKAMMRKKPEERAKLDEVIVAIEEKISSVRPPRMPCAD